MNDNVVVKLENVSKYYKLYSSPKDRLKEALNPSRKKYHKEFYALRDISFELKKGECLGIIGRNGMGKSTLLKLVAHIIEPSSGNVFVNGSVSALLELGTGFNPEFTGLQNVFFYGTILGFERKEIEQKLNEIIAFADIGDFINQPVKTYSSGMFVRLAFAVQTSLTPDILLVDEVLSVGDIFFQQKCHARIEELMKKGTSIILVSHDLLAIQKYSSTTIFLNEGSIFFHGNTLEAIHKYYQSDFKNLHISIQSSKSQASQNQLSNQFQKGKIQWPSSENFLSISNIFNNFPIVELTSLAVCNDNLISQLIYSIGEKVNIFYEILVKEPVDFAIGTVSFTNASNLIIHAKDTLQYDQEDTYPNLLNITKGTKIRFKQSFIIEYAIGLYTFSIGLASILKEDLPRVGKLDYLSRDKIVKGIASFPNCGVIEVVHKKVGKIYPFHGLVGVPGSFEVEFS